MNRDKNVEKTYVEFVILVNPTRSTTMLYHRPLLIPQHCFHNKRLYGGSSGFRQPNMLLTMIVARGSYRVALLWCCLKSWSTTTNSIFSVSSTTTHNERNDHSRRSHKWINNILFKFNDDMIVVDREKSLASQAYYTPFISSMKCWSRNSHMLKLHSQLWKIILDMLSYQYSRFKK